MCIYVIYIIIKIFILLFLCMYTCQLNAIYASMMVFVLAKIEVKSNLDLFIYWFLASMCMGLGCVDSKWLILINFEWELMVMGLRWESLDLVMTMRTFYEKQCQKFAKIIKFRIIGITLVLVYLVQQGYVACLATLTCITFNFIYNVCTMKIKYICLL